ncbi:MAG: hypothetical protein JSV03_10065 [Planctomycetota bacterium]|nr:MAG: hypothetical protein JSV03_10065 [Planctomycetota bacterium]
MQRLILVWLLMLLSTAGVEVNGQSARPSVSQLTKNKIPKSLADRLGCTHCQGSYNFTDKDYLNEGADEILATGMRVIKIWLNKPRGNYPFNSDYPDYEDLVDIVRDPNFRKLFAKPFSTFILTAYSFPEAQDHFRFGVDEERYSGEVQQFYKLTKYLLTAYRGTGKTFVLQHWEGDWAIRPAEDRQPPKDPTPTAIEGMIRWLNGRQEGVDKARKEVGDSDVNVYHACEVNLVEIAMEGKKSVTNDVVPYTHCDLYSYSAYDTINYARWDPGLLKAPKLFRRALDYLASKAPDSKDFGDKNIYIGEFGQPSVRSERDWTANEQNSLRVIRMTVEESLDWGCPYIVYWQVYDNERRVYHRRPGNDEVRGFYLIKPDGTRAPAWYYFTSLLNGEGLPSTQPAG